MPAVYVESNVCSSSPTLGSPLGVAHAGESLGLCRWPEQRSPGSARRRPTTGPLLDALLDESRVAHVGSGRRRPAGGHPDRGRPRRRPGAAPRLDRVAMDAGARHRAPRLSGGHRARRPGGRSVGLRVVDALPQRGPLRVVHAGRSRAPRRRRALDILTESLLPGRVARYAGRRPRSLPRRWCSPCRSTEWSLKVSDGWPEDPPEDVEGDAWAGVVPLTLVAGPALDAPDLRPGIAVPASVRQLAQAP